MRIFVSTVVLAAAVIAAGCGGTTRAGGGSGGDPVADAADKTAAEKTSRVHLTVNVRGSSDTVADGVVGYHSGVVAAKVAFADGGDSFSYNAVVTRDANYIGVDEPLRAKLGISKHWFKSSGGFGQLGNVAREPADLLRFLKDTTNVADLGAADVRGVTTEHYEARIDFDQVLAELPAGFRAQARSAVRDYDAKLLERGLLLDIWIDSDGRVRRLEAEDQDAPHDSFSATLDLFDFGVAEPDEPPPNDVVSSSSDYELVPYVETQTSTTFAPPTTTGR